MPLCIVKIFGGAQRNSAALTDDAILTQTPRKLCRRRSIKRHSGTEGHKKLIKQRQAFFYTVLGAVIFCVCVTFIGHLFAGYWYTNQI